MSGQIIAIIDEHLNGHGQAIFEAAVNAGFEVELNEEGRLDIADACALVDHESGGGINQFGCDWGSEWTWEPPYCQVPVTAERIAALLANIEDGGGQNGVGLTQLTSVEYVYEAERRGGAHLPEHQCSVGFEFLYDTVGSLGYSLGIGAYNAGWGNARLGIDNGYYAKIQTSREKWVKLLSEIKKVEPDTLWIYTDEEEWEREWHTGAYIRAMEKNAEFLTNANGYQYAKGFKKVTPSRWSWPAANKQPGYLGDGSYLDLHPTRYNWLSEVEEVARYVWDEYGLWCNTYVGHPPPELVQGVYYDQVSMDIWGPKGRGDASQSELVTTAFYDIFNNGRPPWIRWCIRNGWIWDDYNGWRPYWDQDPWSDGPHVNHAHFTFYENS